MQATNTTVRIPHLALVLCLRTRAALGLVPLTATRRVSVAPYVVRGHRTAASADSTLCARHPVGPRPAVLAGAAPTAPSHVQARATRQLRTGQAQVFLRDAGEK